MRRSAEARKLAKALADELSAAGEAAGVSLEWGAAEATIIEQIQDETDRKCEILDLYHGCDDAGLKLKLSAEARLLEGSIARLLKQVRTELPPSESQKTVKARAAADARWRRGA
ncbi:hypothetical protein [Tsukamurella sp. USMM236]|uniref:hypothetical protein n=1 Tax=Tsukamurella sp. USMM236 TaxID=3081301 RepID=UPI0030187709